MEPMEPFKIKRNDLQPVYPFSVVDADGSVPFPPGTAIVCNMKVPGGQTLKVNRSPCVITDPTGLGEYHWQVGDTDSTGVYEIEFEVTPPVGGKFTIPNKPEERAIVMITDDLDAV